MPEFPIPEQRPPATDVTDNQASNLHDLPAMLARAQELARRMVPCEADADDVAQDATLNYWLKCEQRDQPRSPAAYLGTVVRNQVTSHWRRLNQKTSHETSLDAPTNEYETPASSLPSPMPDVPEQICNKETVADVYRNWPLLSNQERHFLALWLEGYQPEEIGQMLEANANQVSACVSRARKKLKRLFELSLLSGSELAQELTEDKKAFRLWRRQQALRLNQTED